MQIDWITHAAGREGQLEKLRKQRDDVTQPRWKRRIADQTYKKIQNQLSDTKLSGLRERLMKAAIAGDLKAQAMIQLQIRDYLGEEKETGLYEQD